jgi:hypothetical protein
MSTLNSIIYFCERQHQIITNKVEIDEFWSLFVTYSFQHLQYTRSIQIGTFIELLTVLLPSILRCQLFQWTSSLGLQKPLA